VDVVERWTCSAGERGVSQPRPKMWRRVSREIGLSRRPGVVDANGVVWCDFSSMRFGSLLWQFSR
jgi:hypothetical protein